MLIKHNSTNFIKFETSKYKVWIQMYQIQHSFKAWKRESIPPDWLQINEGLQ